MPADATAAADTAVTADTDVIADLGARPSHVTPVPLSTVATAIGAALGRPAGAGEAAVAVTGITLDSRAVHAGDLYAALPGSRTHGAAFAGDAAAAGAVAMLTDPEGAAAGHAAGLPVLVVPQPRRHLGTAAAVVYGDPASAFALIGVTGTHGKTTTTHLAESAIGCCGLVPARIGTVGTAVAGQPVSSRLTTPEAPELHALFALMRERGVDACAMEVSSHSLVLGRVDGVVFDLAVFTNLGRDHLDFHASLEDYFSAKAALFTPQRARRALVNVDDEHGRRLAGGCRIPVRTFSSRGRDADWRASDVTLSGDGATFDVIGPGGWSRRARVQLPGAFNVANALAAIAALVDVGLPRDSTARGVGDAVAIPGRMERIAAGQDFLAVVDYAHKPDAVSAALQALRGLTPGRLVVVLGAGGDRDEGKRALMGEVAARLADVVVVTDDNPRSERPGAIRAALLAGAARVPPAQRADLVEVGDRRAAIRRALGEARSGDCVLVAGKGHERGQEAAGGLSPFDDRLVVREELANLGFGGRS